MLADLLTWLFLVLLLSMTMLTWPLAGSSTFAVSVIEDPSLSLFSIWISVPAGCAWAFGSPELGISVVPAPPSARPCRVAAQMVTLAVYTPTISQRGQQSSPGDLADHPENQDDAKAEEENRLVVQALGHSRQGTVQFIGATGFPSITSTAIKLIRHANPPDASEVLRNIVRTPPGRMGVPVEICHQTVTAIAAFTRRNSQKHHPQLQAPARGR